MIGIRVDANAVIATGHIMRCMSIARELVKLGSDVVFIVSDDMAADIAAKNGYKVVTTGVAYDDKEAELGALTDIIKKYAIDVLLLDSYQVTEKYFSELSRRVKLAYIDDIFAGFTRAKLLICYHVGIDAESEVGMELGKRCERLLLGPKYFPLREEFREGKTSVNSVVSDIMITTGGTDPYGITKKILSEFDFEKYPVRLHVVVGRMFSNEYDRELKMLSEANDNIVLCRNVTRMSDIMRQCDIAITAGGTTVGELAAIHVPCVAFAFANNQELIFKYEKQGLIAKAVDMRGLAMAKKALDEEYSCGLQAECESKHGYTQVQDLLLEVYKLIDDETKRKEVYDCMAATIDGMGAARIAEELAEL